VTLDVSALQGLQDIAATYAAHVCREAHHFTRHRGRSQIGSEDVLLIARSNPSVAAHLRGLRALPPPTLGPSRAPGGSGAASGGGPRPLHPNVGVGQQQRRAPSDKDPRPLTGAPGDPAGGAVEARSPLAGGGAPRAGGGPRDGGAGGGDGDGDAFPGMKRGAATWSKAPEIRAAAAERATALRHKRTPPRAAGGAAGDVAWAGDAPEGREGAGAPPLGVRGADDVDSLELPESPAVSDSQAPLLWAGRE